MVALRTHDAQRAGKAELVFISLQPQAPTCWADLEGGVHFPWNVCMSFHSEEGSEQMIKIARDIEVFQSMLQPDEEFCDIMAM